MNAPLAKGEVAVPKYDVAAFYDTTSMDGGSFSPDGSKFLASLDASGVFNLYEVSLSGAAPRQLTHSSSRALFAVEYFPRDERYLYLADSEGDEATHLYVVDEDHAVRDLTPGENVKANFLGWGENDSTFYVTSNAREASLFDVYSYRTEDYGAELIFRNPGAFVPEDVSPNGRWIALGRSNSATDSDIYVARVGNPHQEERLVTPHMGSVSHRFLGFGSDSRVLHYATDEYGEFEEVWTLDMETGERAPSMARSGDIWDVIFSRSGRFRAATIDEDARTTVQVDDTTMGRSLPLLGLPPDASVSTYGFDREEKRLALRVSSDREAPNLWIADLDSGRTHRVTSNMTTHVDLSALVSAVGVRYPSFDGLEIPALLYRPKISSSAQQSAAVVVVHGGPGGQSRVGYDPVLQILASHGYVVLAINNRGSSGYGKTFEELDNRRHGDIDLKDCVWAQRYLASLPGVDGERVAIMGSSYGGYLVVAAMAFEPEVFAAGIDIFGVTNWLRTLESIPEWWGPERAALYDEMGDPKTDHVRLRAISPLFHTDQIRRPLLVVQGANDPRVLRAESDELVAALRSRGTPVDYVVFDDEGHGFQKKRNRIAAAEQYLKFLDEYLQGRHR